IGASGVTFQQVNCTGGVNGIVLNNTGTGGLTITGDGGSIKNASGGTISGTSGAGISITSGSNISLDQMTIQDALSDGLITTTVNNFSLTNSIITNNGNELNEHGIDFTNVTGIVRVTNSSFTNNEHEQIHIYNDVNGSTADYELSGVAMVSTGVAAAPNGSHGINMSAWNSASIDLRVLGNSTIDNMFSNSIQVQNEGTGTVEVTIAQTSFTNIGASAINIAQNSSGPVRFNINNNPTFLRGSNNGVSQSININQAGGAPAGALLEGQISNNTIGSNASTTAGSKSGDGIRVLSVGSGTTTVRINNNNIQGVGGNGINVQMSEDANTAHTMNATIFSNTVSVTDVNSFDGIRAVGGAASGDAGIMRLDIYNNNASSATGNDFNVRQRFSTTVQLLGYGGGSSDVAAVQNYLDVTKNNNPLGAGTDWFITIQAPGGGFVNTASVPQPTLPSN
ncbi:hypothetical protein, partial [Segetibacter aerophilus]|uniref:hypothetical protein n=1 Tax=Segetibacter aerophilus TaxID=670293 RepID=UPI001478D407